MYDYNSGGEGGLTFFHFFKFFLAASFAFLAASLSPLPASNSFLSNSFVAASAAFFASSALGIGG
jgi:hypothetical protein